MPFNINNAIQWLISTSYGMIILSTISGLLAIAFMSSLGAFLKICIRPNVEHTFYNTILKQWFGGFFLKRKIIATFIKMNNMGELIVDSIIHLIGMFIVVACLSSALTATILHLQQHAFIYSLYLLFLMSANCMLIWSLGKNLIYFRKVVYRLK